MSIILTKDEDLEGYVTCTVAKKVTTKKVSAKILCPAHVKTQKHEREETIKPVVTKRLTGNNVQMSDLPEFAQEKW